MRPCWLVFGSLLFPLAIDSVPGRVRAQQPQRQKIQAAPLVVGKPLRARFSEEDPKDPNLGRLKFFAFTAADGGDYTVSAGALEFDVMVVPCDEQLRPLPVAAGANDDLGRGDSDCTTFPTEKGKRYVVEVAATFDETGEFDISLTRGAPPATSRTKGLEDDFEFFTQAFELARKNGATGRAARVGWRAALAAIVLARIDDAEAWLAKATKAVDAAEQGLEPAEPELLRLQLEFVQGALAQAHADWKTATQHFSDMERRSAKAESGPVGDAWIRPFFHGLRTWALAGLVDSHIETRDFAAALAAALELEKLQQKPASGDPPTVIECALPLLLDQTGSFEEASRRDRACASLLAKCATPPQPASVVQYARFLEGRGRYAEAVVLLRKALAQAEGERDDVAILMVAGDLAASLLELGGFAEAREIGERRLRAALATGSALGQADARLALAAAKLEEFLYEPARGDAAAARRVYADAKAAGKVAEADLILAEIAIAEGRPGVAERALADVQQSCEAAGRPANAVAARIDHGRALMQQTAATATPDCTAARAVFAKALQDADALHDRRLAALARANLAEVACVEGSHDEACRFAQEAIDAFTALGRYDELQEPLRTIATSALRVKDAALARAKLAAAEEALRNPTLAGASGDGAALLRASLWKWGEVAQDLTTLELDAEKDEAKRAQLVAEGWRAACRWKSRALLAGIDRNARRSEAGAGELAVEWRDQVALQDRRSRELAAAFARSAAKPELELLQKSLHEASDGARRLGEALDRKAPPRTEGDVPTLADLRAKVVGKETLFVEFANGGARLYAYAIDADAIRRIDLGPRGEVEAATLDYGRLVSEVHRAPSAADVAKAGQELYARLLREVIEAVQGGARRRLLVAPTVALGALPFDALVVRADAPPAGRAATFRELHFVGDERVVATIPSGAVACELAGQRARARGGATLLIGAPVRNAKGADDGADMRDELVAVARQLQSKAEAADVDALVKRKSGSLRAGSFELHLGEAATKAALRGDLARFATLHFACHGEADPADPRDTALLLAPSDGDLGHLCVLDVLELKLDADVTVLSACSSARGRRIDGDCEQSLARAFLAAGSRAVVATLWDVDDPATGALMRRFYAAIAAAKTNAGAPVDFAEQLAFAKRAIRRGGAPHGSGLFPTAEGDAPAAGDVAPALWAGIVCIGVPPRK